MMKIRCVLESIFLPLGLLLGSLGTSWEGVLPFVGLLGTLWGHPGAAGRPILASNKSPKWAFERK